MGRPRQRLNYPEISNLLHDIHTYGVNLRTREIFLGSFYSDSDSEPGVDYRSANTFLKNIKLLEHLGRSKVTIHMLIDGGSWYDGLAIFDAIRSAKVSSTTIIAYAGATSMSGVIMQAANRRIMMPHTHFMMHYGTIGFDDTASMTAASTVKFNELGCKKMIDIFAARAVASRFFRAKKWNIRKVAEYLDLELKKRGDWFLSAEESVDLGVSDEIYIHGVTKL